MQRIVKSTLILLITLFLLITAATPLFSQNPVNAEELLQKAESFFKEGNELMDSNPSLSKEKYKMAVQYYNSLIESGITNAKLFYNAGNAYFRLDILGMAILNYRRALLHSPGDEQIRYNLAYARSQQKNGFAENTQSEILQVLFFWHYMLPVTWKIVLLIAANLCFWSALIFRRFGKSIGYFILIPLFIGILLAGSFVIDWQNSKNIHGVVTAESSIGRMGDSRSYQASFEVPLYQGVEFTIEERRVGWILARLPNGDTTWIEDQECTIIEEY
jgi:tetratricopeptide (TPR) repeat protein